MTSSASTVILPLQRERIVILGVLLLLAASAWVVLIWQAGMMDEGEMSLDMGMSAPLFIAVWAAMMVAIMFPTAAPMILAFARVQGSRKQSGNLYVPTWVFMGTYLVVWAASGLLAYAAAVIGDKLADQSMWVMDNAGRIGGVVLVVAGLYQLSPLKTTCLSKCRSPMSFIVSSWRDGYGGALRMGLEHALFCFGCCWLLFVILFPLGMMNIAVLAAITLLIYVEKSFPLGQRFAHVVALGLIAYGATVILVPDALPSML
jgi:predicted metal-binding membrane protein